eukprot:16696-Heterococcus_DN1.PRE.1
MRKPGGYAKIIEAIEKLGKKHEQHILAYGEGNERRLTGRHETASMDKFSYGVANRGASIRIGRQNVQQKSGKPIDPVPWSTAAAADPQQQGQQPTPMYTVVYSRGTDSIEGFSSAYRGRGIGGAAASTAFGRVVVIR